MTCEVALQTTVLDPASSHCPICGGERLRCYHANAFDCHAHSPVSIRECIDCAFSWQYPLAQDTDQSRQFFEEAYASAAGADSGYFDPVKKNQVAAMELTFVNRLPVGEKTLLDIGAGSGIFALAAASDGWRVTAVDPALDTGRLADCPAIRAHKGTLTILDGNDRFDVVTLWDVIEHAIDPVAVLAAASHFVKPEGWLVLETGNFKSADRVAGGPDHWIYQLDHRWYFAPDSLGKLLREAGFDELTYCCEVLRPGWRGTVNFRGPTLAGLIKSLLRDPLRAGLHLRKYRELYRARRWEMAGIGIFAVAARRRGSAADLSINVLT